MIRAFFDKHPEGIVCFVLGVIFGATFFGLFR